METGLSICMNPLLRGHSYSRDVNSVVATENPGLVKTGVFVGYV